MAPDTKNAIGWTKTQRRTEARFGLIQSKALNISTCRDLDYLGPDKWMILNRGPVVGSMMPRDSLKSLDERGIVWGDWENGLVVGEFKLNETGRLILNCKVAENMERRGATEMARIYIQEQGVEQYYREVYVPVLITKNKFSKGDKNERFIR